MFGIFVVCTMTLFLCLEDYRHVLFSSLHHGSWWWFGSLFMVNGRIPRPIVSAALALNNIKAVGVRTVSGCQKMLFLFSLHLPSLLPPVGHQWFWDKILAKEKQTCSWSFLTQCLLSDIGTTPSHCPIFLLPGGRGYNCWSCSRLFVIMKKWSWKSQGL